MTFNLIEKKIKMTTKDKLTLKMASITRLIIVWLDQERKKSSQKTSSFTVTSDLPTPCGQRERERDGNRKIQALSM